MPLLRKSSNPAKTFFCVSALFVAAFSFVAVPAFAQQAQMVALATKTADAISKAHEKSVVVANFWSPEDKLTKLGQTLADQFSTELAGLAKFHVQDRVRLHNAIERNGLSPLSLRDTDIAAWMAQQAGAKAIILGNIEPVNGLYKLTIGVYTVAKERNLGNFGVTLPTGLDWETLFQTPIQEIVVTGLPEAGKGGYTTPQCAYCPAPSYSDAAFRNHLEGMVILHVVVGPDDRAHDIVVMKKLGLGLDESAVKAVQKWKFKPATGPNGQPAAVHMLVEVAFNLYK